MSLIGSCPSTDVIDGLAYRIVPSGSTIVITSVECCTRALNRASLMRAVDSVSTRNVSRVDAA